MAIKAMTMTLNWYTKSFEDLSVSELYEILTLRSEVFVVEQNCVFLDMDHKDQQSQHFMGWNEGDLVAYCRILPPGLSYIEPSIGRVVSSPRYRKTGAGRQMMEKAIAITRQQFGDQPIRIGAQLYLSNFYASLGFQAQGDVYLEDGIEHVEMVLFF
jgi:ElaA protein